MSKQHRTGIIGLGIMGQRMLEHMVRHEAFAPVSLWDPSPDACQAAAGLCPEAQIAGSADEVMAGADLIYLACPPVPRKAYALAASAAGKAVFLEKPLGIDVGESRQLVDRLAADGVPAAVNFTQAAGEALARITGDADMGPLCGVDIVVTYPRWPRAWQADADWLRFAAEGGFTREVISHFVFFAARVLGPLKLVWARPSYPADDALCETHMAARLETAGGVPVSVFASVGGAQPDRQELTVKGTVRSYRVSEFYMLSVSDGGPFSDIGEPPVDARAVSLKAQLDEMDKAIGGLDHKLATPAEALRVQELIEAMLRRT
ncbi:MAG: Gfo/Idh/MocA family oxidoreductase [Hyphomicrobiales bacterium]|nr:Gfo/Idh/MocA family oxidoreductase [Hyphomicrobiales bacterium]